VPAIPYSQMPDFYRLADVVVSVPESDAGPVTLVEALAAGRPIVCSDLPPVREWLAEIDPAALVPVGDSVATAAAIRTVLARGTQQRSDVAERGRAAVLERADQRRTMAEFEMLYRQLAAGRPARSTR
jgi:glycosyltransferase involved in cell wall biosynthesis